MRVDRSYLPFQSAREYQDRKMAKWMGFFISEHTTALKQIPSHISVNHSLSDWDKALYLQQAYVAQLQVILVIQELDKQREVRGQVMTIDRSGSIGFQTDEHYLLLALDEVLNIQLMDGGASADDE